MVERLVRCSVLGLIFGSHWVFVVNHRTAAQKAVPSHLCDLGGKSLDCCTESGSKSLVRSRNCQVIHPHRPKIGFLYARGGNNKYPKRRT